MRIPSPLVSSRYGNTPIKISGTDSAGSLVFGECGPRLPALPYAHHAPAHGVSGEFFTTKPSAAGLITVKLVFTVNAPLTPSISTPLDVLLVLATVLNVMSASATVVSDRAGALVLLTLLVPETSIKLSPTAKNPVESSVEMVRLLKRVAPLLPCRLTPA